MLGKYGSIGFCVALLIGCSSNSPSERDIKKELENAFASCTLATIKDVKRLNGEQGPENNRYLVDVSFVLDIKPVPNASERSTQAQKIEEESTANAKNLSVKISSLDARIQELKDRRREEVDAAQKELADYRYSEAFAKASADERFRVSSEIQKKINDLLIRHDSQIKPLSEKLYGLQLSLVNTRHESASVRKSLVDDFARLCQIRGKFAERVFLEQMALRTMSNIKTPLGGTFELHYKIWMKKTDNGWVFNI